MKLDELQVGDARARAVRHRHPVAGRDRRIRRLAEHLAGAAGRQQRAAARAPIARVPSSRRTRRPTHCRSSTMSDTTRACDWMRTLASRDTRSHSARPISRPVASLRVQHAPRAVRRLERELGLRRRAPRSNAAPHSISSRTYRGPSSTSTATARSSHKPSPAAIVSARCRAGTVVRRRRPRRSRPARIPCSRRAVPPW